jgi:DNA transformation protein
MKRNRELADLKNIGPKLHARLKQVGIHGETDLRRAGAVEAYRRIAGAFPEETLPVCYYLYSFEGALRDLHWDDIGADRKMKLKKMIARSLG